MFGAAPQHRIETHAQKGCDHGQDDDRNGHLRVLSPYDESRNMQASPFILPYIVTIDK
jgi:hypothetical protein